MLGYTRRHLFIAFATIVCVTGISWRALAQVSRLPDDIQKKLAEINPLYQSKIGKYGPETLRLFSPLLATGPKAGVTVVALERRRSGRFVGQARELGVPVIIRDMKEDQALIDAGIEHARAIVIATNDAIANLEVALDAKRMNPSIRVVMRMFDEKVAHKISDAMDVDVAFSSSTLAAPVVAKMAMERTTS